MKSTSTSRLVHDVYTPESITESRPVRQVRQKAPFTRLRNALKAGRQARAPRPYENNMEPTAPKNDATELASRFRKRN